MYKYKMIELDYNIYIIVKKIKIKIIIIIKKKTYDLYIIIKKIEPEYINI